MSRIIFLFFYETVILEPDQDHQTKMPEVLLRVTILATQTEIRDLRTAIRQNQLMIVNPVQACLPPTQVQQKNQIQLLESQDGEQIVHFLSIQETRFRMLTFIT